MLDHPYIDLTVLSDDAKVVAGTLMGLKTSVTFHMEQGRPSGRAQSALDELVEKGVIARSCEHGLKSMTYRSLMNLMPAFQWVAKLIDTPEERLLHFNLTEAA